MIAGRSDIGQVRTLNEDNYLIAHNGFDNTLAIVCDGIGGAKAGDVASLMAIKKVGNAFSKTDKFTTTASGKLWLEKILRVVNDEIFSETMTNPDYQGMGTTFVCAMIINKEIVVANVGDSRAYVLLNDELIQITSDHSLVNDLIKSGQIDPSEAETHPQRNILTNALGVLGELKIDTFVVNRGQRLLLCSDGLSGYVKHEDIYKQLSNEDILLEEVLKNLIDAANAAGGFDNITAIVIDLGGIFNE